MEETKPLGQPLPEPKPAEPKPGVARSISDILQTVQIALDSYDDIFSDFDPAPYERRLISGDFLKALQGHHAETSKGGVEVRFTLPRSLRSEKTEHLVRKRIREYFKDRLRDTEKELRGRRKAGAVRIGLGLAVAALLFLVPLDPDLPFITLLSVLVWYCMWSGYEQLFDMPLKLEGQRAFFGRFMRAKYEFMDQEQVVESIRAYASGYR